MVVGVTVSVSTTNEGGVAAVVPYLDLSTLSFGNMGENVSFILLGD